MFISCSFIQIAQANPHSECVEYLDELASVIGRLDDKTRKLLVENTKLRRNNEELKTQNQELTSEIVKDLKSDIEDLKSDIEDLESENEKLKKQLAEFKEKIMQLNFVLKIMGHPQSEPESDED
jgi:chromosome segregation ATPase